MGLKLLHIQISYIHSCFIHAYLLLNIFAIFLGNIQDLFVFFSLSTCTWNRCMYVYFNIYVFFCGLGYDDIVKWKAGVLLAWKLKDT